MKSVYKNKILDIFLNIFAHVCVCMKLQGLLGIFFKVRAPALAEDIPINNDEWARRNYSYSYIVELYDQNAINCWIATGLYCITFVVSVVMFKINQRSNYVQS